MLTLLALALLAQEPQLSYFQDGGYVGKFSRLNFNGTELGCRQSGLVVSCGPITTGGGGSANVLETSLTLTSSGLFRVTVTGATWVKATSNIVCGVLGTTADGLTPEAIAVAELGVSIQDRVNGVGFTVNVMNTKGLTGTVRIHCTGA